MDKIDFQIVMSVRAKIIFSSVALASTYVVFIIASSKWHFSDNRNKSGYIIDRLGLHQVGDNGAFVEVYPDDGKYNIKFRSIVTTHGSNVPSERSCANGFINPKQKWLVFVKNECELWVLYNQYKVERWFDGDKTGGCVSYNISSQEFIRDAPQGLVNIVKSEVNIPSQNQ